MVRYWVSCTLLLAAVPALADETLPPIRAITRGPKLHWFGYYDHLQFDRALELYALALPIHPNPEAIRTNIEAVRRRREAARTATPGNRNEAFDYGRHTSTTREITP